MTRKKFLKSLFRIIIRTCKTASLDKAKINMLNVLLNKDIIKLLIQRILYHFVFFFLM